MSRAFAGRSSVSRVSRISSQKDWALRTAPLDIDEVDVVGGGVDHCPKSHRVGDLTVEPDVLIGGEKPSELWSDYANNVSQHREEDEAAIVSEDEPRASRGPNGELQGVEARKCGVDCLWVEATVSCRPPAW